MTNNPKYIVIHCSDVSERSNYDQFNSINNFHRDDRGFSRSSLGYYVGYHRLITGGKNYKTREDNEEGCHCNQGFDGVNIYQPGTKPYGVLSMNLQSLGVCVGFDGDIEYMSPIHYDLLQKQIFEWQDKYGISNDRVFFHRHFAVGKTCPGALLQDTWMKQLLTRPMTSVPTTKVPTESCTYEKTIIEEQKVQIGRLQSLIALLTKIWNKI